MDLQFFYFLYNGGRILITPQSAITCSKLTIEILKQDVNYVQS